MYHAMTNSELQNLVQRNLDLVNLAYQDPTLNSFSRKERINELRKEIIDIWAEQRFRTALRIKKIKVQSPIT